MKLLASAALRLQGFAVSFSATCFLLHLMILRTFFVLREVGRSSVCNALCVSTKIFGYVFSSAFNVIANFLRSGRMENITFLSVKKNFVCKKEISMQKSIKNLIKTTPKNKNI